MRLYEGEVKLLKCVKGIKNGKTGLKIMSPLYTHNEDGSYVEEIRKMFGGNEDVAE